MNLSDKRELVHHARTFLFVPADRPDRFDKAAGSGCDVVVIDLEDSVALDSKEQARRAARAWLDGGGRACVRINDTASASFGADLESLARLPGLLAVMLPKSGDPRAATRVADRLRAPAIALIESAEGLMRAHEIASAPGVDRLAFGHLDYALDIGADPGRLAMLHARSAIVVASRTARVPGPIDGVTTNLDDTRTVSDDAQHARELGFTAKLLVHPGQVAGARAALLPDEQAVAWARRVLASVAGGEAARVDGQMVDAPVLARARAILADSTA